MFSTLSVNCIGIGNSVQQVLFILRKVVESTFLSVLYSLVCCQVIEKVRLAHIPGAGTTNSLHQSTPCTCTETEQLLSTSSSPIGRIIYPLVAGYSLLSLIYVGDGIINLCQSSIDAVQFIISPLLALMRINKGELVLQEAGDGVVLIFNLLIDTFLDVFLFLHEKISLLMKIGFLLLTLETSLISGILLHVRKRPVIVLISTFSDIRGLHLTSFRIETWLALNDMTVRSKLYRLHLQAGVCLLVFHLVVETMCRSISLSKDVANIGCVPALVSLSQRCALRLDCRLGWLMHNRLVNLATSRLNLWSMCSWLVNLLVWVPLGFTCSTCP